MSDNIKEALGYAVELAAPIQYEINGETFASKQLHRIDKRKDDLVSPLKVSTLTGLIDYITANRDNLDLSKTILQITDVDAVRLVSVPNKDKARETYIEAEAILPAIPYDAFIGLEKFNILLQAAFEDTEDRANILKYVTHIKIDEGITVTDDGTAQQIVARTGAANFDNVILPNPVILKPFRTFQELEQVESAFVFRLDKEGRCALFEADGGVWKVRCRERVKEYLEQNLRRRNTHIDIIS